MPARRRHAVHLLYLSCGKPSNGEEYATYIVQTRRLPAAVFTPDLVSHHTSLVSSKGPRRGGSGGEKGGNNKGVYKKGTSYRNKLGALRTYSFRLLFSCDSPPILIASRNSRSLPSQTIHRAMVCASCGWSRRAAKSCDISSGSGATDSLCRTSASPCTPPPGGTPSPASVRNCRSAPSPPGPSAGIGKAVRFIFLLTRSFRVSGGRYACPTGPPNPRVVGWFKGLRYSCCRPLGTTYIILSSLFPMLLPGSRLQARSRPMLSVSGCLPDGGPVRDFGRCFRRSNQLVILAVEFFISWPVPVVCRWASGSAVRLSRYRSHGGTSTSPSSCRIGAAL